MYLPGFSLNIRNKLLLVFLSLIIPTLVLTNFLWINSMKPILEQNIIRSQQRLTQTAGFQISSFINEKVDKLSLNASDVAFLSKDLQAGQFQIEAMLQQDDSIKNISFIDQSGDELIHINQDGILPKEHLTNVKDSEGFNTVTYRYGLDYISQIYFSETKEPLLTIAVPIRMPSQKANIDRISALVPTLKNHQGGEILGILSTEITLSKLFNTISNLKIGKDEYIYVLDENNRIVTHPNPGFINTNLSNSKIDIVEKHKETDKEYIAEQGYHPSELFITSQGISERNVEVLATHQHVPFLNWGVVVEQPISEAFSALNTTERFAIFLFIGGLITTILVSLWFSYRFTHPIRLLQKGVEVIGSGKLDYRLDIPTHDEIQQLSQSFNQMASNLKGAFLRLDEDKNIISAERNKLAVTLASIDDGVIVVDLKQNIILFNKSAEDLTGFKEEEVIGRNLDQVLKVFDKDTQLTIGTYCPIRVDGYEGVVFSRQELKLVGVKESYINLVSGQISEGPDVNVGCILTMHDITKEKELEKMKLDFVAIAAHELRTPLTSIRGYLSVFIDENKDKLNEDQNGLLMRASNAGNQLNSLIEDLLSISKIENRKLSVSQELIDLKELATKVVSDFTYQAKDKNIDLQFTNPTEEIPKVKADRLKIVEVLSNFVSNAINYTQSGGKVLVHLEQKGGQAIVHVSDNGPGIPAEAIPHLFTKFFRVTGALGLGTKGTGLGLFISKSIIELHKGKIWLDSEVGKGSTFSFSLPISTEEKV